jgi:hypothetical protein
LNQKNKIFYEVKMFIRYAVFAGDKYYPTGGWADIKSAGNDLEALKKYLADNKERWDW